MEYGVLALVVAALGIFLFRKFRKPDENTINQRALEKYLSESLSPVEIGRFYERYIGHLYEVEGYDVQYHGAVNGTADLGRDLIIRGADEVLIVQTKCWAKGKYVHENHIFQLYGTMKHFELTSRSRSRPVRAIFYTTADYSEVSRDVAQVLGVELKTEELNKSYPMIKCNVTAKGQKIYHLPFDPFYDKVKIKHDLGEFYVHTVHEAAARGFRRARKYKDAA